MLATRRNIKFVLLLYVRKTRLKSFYPHVNNLARKVKGMHFDTIAAISTPMGEGAIAIVRLSGDEAIDIASRVFRSPNGKKLIEEKTHTIHYGHLIDSTSEEVVEEVMVSVMKEPKTFTREDVVEINCHGGLVAVNRVLALILKEGARLAEPGEFTKRAFLNGRIDLSQSEAVMDLIRAKTDRAMNVALGQMDGKLSRLINKLRNVLVETLAEVEVKIDYPEYDDVEEKTLPFMVEKCTWVAAEIDDLLTTSAQGKILREGLSTVIVGRPNVGKSSLLNNLVQENRAIVTDVAGTTRDIIEEYVNVRGVPLRLVDTAGIRETEDIVERIGVERSRQVLKEADLILLVLNNAEELSEEDKQLFKAVEGMDTIIIVNKTDLPQKIDLAEVKQLAGDSVIVTLSLLEDAGIDELELAIANLFFAGNLEAEDLTYVSNARHIALLHKAKATINDALFAAEAGVPIDMIQIDVTSAWETLGEIVGDTVQEGLINELFSRFCLGK